MGGRLRVTNANTLAILTPTWLQTSIYNQRQAIKGVWFRGLVNVYVTLVPWFLRASALSTNLHQLFQLVWTVQFLKLVWSLIDGTYIWVVYDNAGIHDNSIELSCHLSEHLRCLYKLLSSIYCLCHGVHGVYINSFISEMLWTILLYMVRQFDSSIQIIGPKLSCGIESALTLWGVCCH